MTDKVELKSLLCSLSTLNDEERDFKIEYSSGSPRRIRGTYIAKRKILRLYPNTVNKALAKREASLELVGAALHEFAHHLHVTRNKVALTSWFHQGRKIPLHGAEFKKILEELLGAFNSRYCESLKGLMVYNRRRARVPPRFVPFDQTSNEAGISIRSTVTEWPGRRKARSQDSWCKRRGASTREVFMNTGKRGNQERGKPGKGPMIFESIMEAYCHYLKVLRSDDDPGMAPPLNTREKYILLLGMIAGRDRQRGIWDVPENKKLREDRAHDAEGTVGYMAG